VVVVAMVVVVDVLVLPATIGKSGRRLRTVVVVVACAVLVVFEGVDMPAGMVVDEPLAPPVDDGEEVVVGWSDDGGAELGGGSALVGRDTPSELVVAVRAAVVVGVAAVVVSAPETSGLVVGSLAGAVVVAGCSAGGPIGTTGVSVVVGAGGGESAAIAGAAAMRAVVATEERERNSRLDIAIMIHALDVPRRGCTYFAQNCSFLVQRTVADRLCGHLRPKWLEAVRRLGEFLGKP
jgi:hypothetical protein